MNANPLRNEPFLEVLAVSRKRMALAVSELGDLEYKIERVRREMHYAPFLISIKGAKVAYGVWNTSQASRLLARLYHSIAKKT